MTTTPHLQCAPATRASRNRTATPAADEAPVPTVRRPVPAPLSPAPLRPGALRPGALRPAPRAPGDALGARRPVDRRRAAGFTLAEVLLAVTIGALLLVALADAASFFFRNLDELKQETDNDVDAALHIIGDHARYAWYAESPNARELLLTDPQGAVTRYRFQAGQLQVTRPDGTSGAMVSGLDAARFAVETVQRLREDSPRLRKATWFQETEPLGPGLAQRIEPGEGFALGFTADSAAPIAGSVPSVDEQLLSARPEVLSIAVGTTGNALGDLVIDLHRARAPGDARPVGPVLGSVSIALNGLPVTGTLVMHKITGKIITPPTKPPIAGWWLKNPNLVFVGAVPPTTTVPIDLSPLAIAIEPGRAYTLAFSVTGGDAVFRVVPTLSPVLSGVATHASGDAYAGAALGTTFALSGTTTMTSTVAEDVGARVTVELSPSGADTKSATTALLGQAGIADPWTGAVKGETTDVAGLKP